MAYKASDIAKLLLQKVQVLGEQSELLTNLKLQKLLYYEQGYHLAYFNTPLFEESIEAWQYGPVVVSVYDEYKRFGNTGIQIETMPTISLLPEEQELFDEVFDLYSKYSAIGLMNMTHAEAPWQSAGAPARGNIISLDVMKTFFKTRLA